MSHIDSINAGKPAVGVSNHRLVNILFASKVRMVHAYDIRSILVRAERPYVQFRLLVLLVLFCGTGYRRAREGTCSQVSKCLVNQNSNCTRTSGAEVLAVSRAAWGTGSHPPRLPIESAERELVALERAQGHAGGSGGFAIPVIAVLRVGRSGDRDYLGRD